MVMGGERSGGEGPDGDRQTGSGGNTNASGEVIRSFIQRCVPNIAAASDFHYMT